MSSSFTYTSYLCLLMCGKAIAQFEPTSSPSILPTSSPTNRPTGQPTSSPTSSPFECPEFCADVLCSEASLLEAINENPGIIGIIVFAFLVGAFVSGVISYQCVKSQFESTGIHDIDDNVEEPHDIGAPINLTLPESFDRDALQLQSLQAQGRFSDREALERFSEEQNKEPGPNNYLVQLELDDGKLQQPQASWLRPHNSGKIESEEEEKLKSLRLSQIWKKRAHASIRSIPEDPSSRPKSTRAPLNFLFGTSRRKISQDKGHSSQFETEDN